jgi:hypothetical protein
MIRIKLKRLVKLVKAQSGTISLWSVNILHSRSASVGKEYSYSSAEINSKCYEKSEVEKSKV